SISLETVEARPAAQSKPNYGLACWRRNSFRNRDHGIVGVGGSYVLNNIAAENGRAGTNTAGIFMAGTGRRAD
ncbi:MAG: hypothetical protein L0219_19375, partial [Phycisphaerales bacterium]|nr:hypothetical protein [Phycisphaerales bacterium]